MCEFCNRTSEIAGVYVVKCYGCNKDICNSCYCFVDDLYEPYSDYNHKACRSCANKIKPYEALAFLIKEKAYNNIEKLIEKWKKECGRDTS